MTEHPSAESPVDPEPGVCQARMPMPLPVRYAWGLLWLQGVIWGGLALLMVIAAGFAVMAILANRNAIVGLAVEVFAGALTAGFAVGAITLARALARGRQFSTAPGSQGGAAARISRPPAGPGSASCGPLLTAWALPRNRHDEPLWRSAVPIL